MAETTVGGMDILSEISSNYVLNDKAGNSGGINFEIETVVCDPKRRRMDNEDIMEENTKDTANGFSKNKGPKNVKEKRRDL